MIIATIIQDLLLSVIYIKYTYGWKCGQITVGPLHSMDYYTEKNILSDLDEL